MGFRGWAEPRLRLDTHGVGGSGADSSPSGEVKKFNSGGSAGQGRPAAKQSRRWWWSLEKQTRAKKKNPSVGLDEKYPSSKGRNGKDIRERTDCSVP